MTSSNASTQITSTLSNWDVATSPVFAELNGQQVAVSGYKAIVRNDNGKTLNICKPGYVPLSNADFIATAEQFSDITGFPIASVHELEGGCKTLAFLECTETIEIDGHAFRDYLMLGNSHDSSSVFFVGNSNTMIRCGNRFARRFKALTARHSASLHTGVQNIREEFQSYRSKQQEYYRTLRQFQKVEVSEEIMNSLIARMASMTTEERLGKEEISTRKKNIALTIEASLQREMNDLGFNLYGLFNGVTHYTTHQINIKGDEGFSLMNRAEKLNLDGFQFCQKLAVVA